jgi:hypothetical protein
MVTLRSVPQVRIWLSSVLYTTDLKKLLAPMLLFRLYSVRSHTMTDPSLLQLTHSVLFFFTCPCMHVHPIFSHIHPKSNSKIILPVLCNHLEQHVKLAHRDGSTSLSVGFHRRQHRVALAANPPHAYLAHV